MAAYSLLEVVFSHDLPLPDGRFGRKLSADERTKITRDGDTLVVEATVPSRDYGVFETVVWDYNWNACDISKRAPVEPPKAVSPAKK